KPFSSKRKQSSLLAVLADANAKIGFCRFMLASAGLGRFAISLFGNPRFSNVRRLSAFLHGKEHSFPTPICSIPSPRSCKGKIRCLRSGFCQHLRDLESNQNFRFQRATSYL